MKAIILLILAIASISEITAGQKISDKKIVIIRDDDVFKLEPGLEWLTTFSVNNNINITYAVIPILIASKNVDKTIIDNLTKLIDNRNNIELATHGYDVLGGLPYDVQYSLIDNGTKLMEQYFGSRLYTFISPHGSCDLNTTKACRDLGYHSISGIAVNDSYLPNFLTNFYWEDYSISNLPNYRIQHIKFSTFVSMFDRFYNSSNEIYVTQMHHATWCNQSGEINTTQIKIFENSIAYMKSKNVEFMTMEQAYRLIYLDSSPTYFVNCQNAGGN
jgi:hypothetical protein